MRHILKNTSEVLHYWSNQTQDWGRLGNVSFDGAVLKSYNTNVAVILKSKAGENVALFSERKYSVTTGGHIGDARYAANHLKQFVVPIPERYFYPNNPEFVHGFHVSSIRYMIGLIPDQLTKGKRGVWFNHYGTALGTIATVLDYINTFGLNRNKLYSEIHGLRAILAPKYREEINVLYQEKETEIEKRKNPDPESADKRERARAKAKYARDWKNAHIDNERWYQRKAKREQHLRDREEFLTVTIPAWKRGEVNLSYSRFYDIPTFLRLSTDREHVETSQGAEITAKHPGLLAGVLEMARMARAGEKEITSETLNDRQRELFNRVFAPYTFSRFEKDGTLVIGCHHIPVSEMEYIARELGIE